VRRRRGEQEGLSQDRAGEDYPMSYRGRSPVRSMAASTKKEGEKGWQTQTHADVKNSPDFIPSTKDPHGDGKRGEGERGSRIRPALEGALRLYPAFS